MILVKCSDCKVFMNKISGATLKDTLNKITTDIFIYPKCEKIVKCDNNQLVSERR